MARPTLKLEYLAAQEACERFLANPSNMRSRPCGLCYNMLNEMRATLRLRSDEAASDEFIATFEQMLRDWPEGTGNSQYPIPDPTDPDRTVAGAARIYGYYGDIGNYGYYGDIWNPACPYGMLRLRLTAYVAERFAALATQSD